LRERGGDIMMLAKHFLAAFAKDNGFGEMKISAEAQHRMLSYPWPGNVRELKAIIELAAVLSDDGIIEEKDLNFNSVSDEMDTLVSEGLSLKEYNRRLIEHYLRKNDNNVVEVAKRLEIGKSTLYRMIKNDEINLN